MDKQTRIGLEMVRKMVEAYERSRIANDSIQPMHINKCDSINSTELANNQGE